MTEHSGVGEAVRAFRRRRGLTLRALAAELGVSPGTVSAIENGKVAVTVRRLGDLAGVLGVAPAELVEFRGEPPAPPAVDGEASWREFGEPDPDPLVTAAVEVFAEVGYHGAAMRDIAAVAGVSVAGIYRHHRSKQRLLVALIDRALDDQSWRVAAARDGADGGAESLRAMIEALALWFAHRRALGFVTEVELRCVEEPDRSRVLARRRALERSIADVAAHVVRDRDPGATAPAAAVAAALSMCRAIPLRLAVEPLFPPAAAARYGDFAVASLVQNR